jgi:hypothetical protein
LNTTYNVVKAASGLFNAAAVILGNTFTITAGKIGLATGAVKLFRTALITTGIGALVVGLGFIIEAIINTNNAAKTGKPYVDNYGGAIRNSGADAEWAAGKYGTAKTAIDNLNSAAAGYRPPNLSGRDMTGYAEGFRARLDRQNADKPDPFADLLPDLTKVSGTAKTQSPLQSLITASKKDEKILNKTNALIGKNLPKDVAQWVASSSKPVVALNQALKRVSKNGPKAIGNLTKAFQNSAAGQAAATEAFEKAQADLKASQDKADQEAAQKLAQQEARYKSFAESVANTFASIRDSIVSAFSLPELGGSTDSIIRNMDKLLTRVKAFSQNITKLSSMGLDPKLLQQVINAGPIAGAKLAANLVSGGVGGLTAINKGYAELGGLASEIGMTGTQAAFNNQAQQNVYNININGGLDSGASIGKAVVDAVRAYERTSGPVWQGA